MREYPKTENLFERDDATKKLIVGQYRNPWVPQIKDWLVTEKIDGTNVRLMLWGGPDGFTAEFRGRSDVASLPISKGKTEADLVNEIWGYEEVPLCNLLVRALDQIEPEREDTLWAMCVYGELHGPGIQKIGGSYGPRKTIRVFDVKTHRMQRADEMAAYVPSSGYWRPWSDVQRAAAALGLYAAPQLRINGNARWSTEDIVNYVWGGCYSRVAAETGAAGFTVGAEGIIARTNPYVFDSRGHRVMFKLKAKDMPPQPDWHFEEVLAEAAA